MFLLLYQIAWTKQRFISVFYSSSSSSRLTFIRRNTQTLIHIPCRQTTPSSLSWPVLNEDLLRRPLCIVSIGIDRWQFHGLSMRIYQLHIFEVGHPTCSDDIVFQLCKSHAQAWMPTDAPSNPRIRLDLVFGTIRQVTCWIPRRSVFVDRRILVNLGKCNCGICTLRDNLCTSLVQRNGSV